MAVLAAAFGGLAGAASACSGGPYVYAGIAGQSRVAGVGAAITPSRTAFDVRAGHVAGWVGVGGPGEGPNGTDEWIQAGFSAFGDWLGNTLYFEVARPGSAPVYSRIRAHVPAGHAVRVSVLEMRHRRDWWRVWVNGAPASKPIHLPQSDRRWRPIVTAESWDAGQDVCNDFSYRFQKVRVALVPGGSWARLRSPTGLGGSQTVLLRHSNDAFVAGNGPLVRDLFGAG